MRRGPLLRLLAVAAVAVAAAALPASASAHPLGNFTINHYAGITIARDRVDVDVVIDMAEIPTFQERQTMDSDDDGSVSDEEAAAWAPTACSSLVESLRLGRDGARLGLTAESSAATFPPGAGGLSTLRLECAFSSTLPSDIDGPTTISFADESYRDRIGWREIVAFASGTILDTGALPRTSPSRRLTAYPADLIATPLDIRSASIVARVDPAVVRSHAPAAASAGGKAPAAAAGTPAVLPVAGAVPGGVAGDLPDIFRTAELTPLAVLGSILIAIAIGAGHALTPGHGKTLMAAYLVGTRGTAMHAAGLGLSVAISHTLGILALAVLIVESGRILPPDLVYRVTPVIAGASIVAIGGWMLIREVRRRARRRVTGDALEQHHVAVAEAHADGARPNVHSHGIVRHSQVRPASESLTWRGLFVLGLAGGLVPSTSALIVLLGSIAVGRPAFGIVLVVAFGIGMAAVMTAVGLAVIAARTRLDRMPSHSSVGRLAGSAPLLSGIAVFGLGMVLTWQALAGSPAL